MIAIVHAIVIIAVGFQIYRHQTLNRRWFWPGLLFKMMAGVGVGMVYTHYYSVGDTFRYWEDACQAAELARTDFGAYLSFLSFGDTDGAMPIVNEPRALFFIRIVSVFALLTLGNYWATGFYLSFLSFLGAWYLVQTISRNIRSASIPAVMAFAFLPSFVFWSSGLLKESISAGALLFLSALFLKVWFNERLRWWDVVPSALSLWLLWNLKYYYAGVFTAVVFTNLMYRFLFRGRRFPLASETLIWLTLLLVPVAVVTLTHPNFHLNRLPAVVAENNAVYNAISEPGDVVHFHDLEPTAVSMAMNAPWALVSGLFRPFPWEASSLMQLAASIENAALLCMFFVCCARIRTLAASPHRVVVVSAIVYIVVLAVFLTLSAPNYGTLSRYRVGYISFFTFVILCNNPVIQNAAGWVSKRVRNLD